LGFEPKYLGPVQAGDTVTAEMVQDPDGWELDFTDATHALSRHFATNYGAKVSFSTAEWEQEDPTDSRSNTNVPYPTMTTANFSRLALNGRTPKLPYADAHALVSPNGFVLVPTEVVRNSFEVAAATAPQTQYLTTVAPVNADAARVYADLEHHSAPALATDTAAMIAAIDATDARLTSEHWSPTVKPLILSLVRLNNDQIRALRAWIATASPTLKTLEPVLANKTRTADVKLVRRALGLPVG
jgi:hypothetical protein